MTDAAKSLSRLKIPALAFIVAVSVLHFGVALTIGERPLAGYFTVKWITELLAMLMIPFGIWALANILAALRNKELGPRQALLAILTDNRNRLGIAAVLLICYALVNRSYRAIKVAIQRIEPFYADTMFLEWDRFLFFGYDPWRLTHALVGPAGTKLIDYLYAGWFVVIILTFALVAFSSDKSFQLRASITYLLVWILLGNLLATVWSSAGPAYYEHFFGQAHFAPLMEILNSQSLIATKTQSYLLGLVGDESLGSGISAMPSVHCGMTMFIVMIAWHRRGFGPVFLAALLYHLVILFGSVHLGWHYAVDGLVSTALVPLIWFAVGAGLSFDGKSIDKAPSAAIYSP